MFDDLEDLDRKLTAESDTLALSTSQSYVLQRYIPRPLLLDGAKFHLRVNVLAVGRHDNSGCDVYVHGGIVAHVATLPYVVGSSDRFVHITNHGVQQAHPEYDREGQTLDLATLEQRLVASLGDAWAGCGQEFLRQACLIAAGVFRVASQRPRDFRPMANCFEVFGFDFLPEDCSCGADSADSAAGAPAFPFKLQLLEVNGGPAMEGAARPDICRRLVDDVLRVVLDPWYPLDKKRDRLPSQILSF